MAKADVIQTYNTEIARLGASAAREDKEQAKKLQKERDYVELSEELAINDADVEAQYRAAARNDLPTAKLLQEYNQSVKAAQEATAERAGIMEELRSATEAYQRIPAVNKIAYGGAFALCAAGVGTLGGPIGAAAAALGIGATVARRTFSGMATFFALEGFLNKPVQNVFGQRLVFHVSRNHDFPL